MEVSWIQFRTDLCNIYVYAKHLEYSSQLNTVPDFMTLIFYWECNQGNRQTKETNKAII